MQVERRLAELGVELIDVARLFANDSSGATYISHRQIGETLYVCGCTPNDAAGEPYLPGVVGRDLTIEQGRAAARQNAIVLISLLRAILGDLDRVVAFGHMTGYVNSADGFNDQPRVINGASELIRQAFGERGEHTRAAIGCRGLGNNSATELVAMVQIEGQAGPALIKGRR